MSSHADPTLAELLDSAPVDPAVSWPVVPPAPLSPGQSFRAVRTTGTAHLIWVQPLLQGSDAGAEWVSHRARFTDTGLWPLLVDDAFWEAVELEPSETGSDLTSAKELLRQLALGPAGDPAVQGSEPERDTVRRGPMPETIDDARAPQQVINSSQEHTTLLLVPARAGWVVPELLGWDGAVNHLVHGQEHTAVLGRWAGLFGAELFGLTRDVLQLLITRPPADEQARLQAAAEMYAFCPDVVDQGVETLEALTQMAGSREWWLWWD